ncbi:hypothetical protein [Phytohabitans rumicis]|uniref:Uncharacterized protein n=1 Tax=Phytohabitans rumicis TaxID=1076125 RepID=A0A6V8L7F2_9ACTN|nr:hypothetical protein [Phytohabitans rumicis]GFJ92194.1 hypothetical protein Prum_058360 [Phytohabitans rumicis]
MVAAGPGRSGWRQRWADRQNEQRRRAFEAAFGAWQRDGDEARRMLTAAQTFAGLPADAVPPYVDLGRAEVAFLVLPGAAIVELPDQPALPAPGYTGFSAYPQPAGPPFAGPRIDAGTAVVTNRRVVLYGNRRREWLYAKLVGFAHLPDNRTTLMRVSNRVRASGLCVEPATAASFRFNLSLALAESTNDRAGFVAHLEQQISEHQRYRPQPPPVAMEQQAPMTARLGPGVLVAAAVTAILLLCGIAVALAPPSPQTSDTPQADSTTTTGRVSSALPTSTPAAPPTSPPPVTAPTTPPRQPPRLCRPARPQPSRPEAHPFLPYAQGCQPVRAPSNPYGYNYCSRGSRITDPKPDICSYFDCIDNFWNGKGYMIECDDGMVSMSGGRQGSCSYHGGNNRTVYDG